MSKVQKKYLLHELMHGVSLVGAMLDKVRGAGADVPVDADITLFSKYPDLEKQFDKIESGIQWLYQFIANGDFKRKSDWRKKGLEQKYEIEKSDGSFVDPDAQYFVLRLDGGELHHYACREAIRTYASIIQTENPKFAVELKEWVDEYSNGSD